MPTSEELSAVIGNYNKLQYFEELSHGLRDSLKNSLFTDVQIEVDGEIFNCHRIILASMSHYFKTMFTSNFKESGLPKVHLKDLDKEIFKAALEYIYTGQSSVKNSNVYHLLSCSSMLQIKGLQSICSEFLRKSLSHNNCIGIWKMATGHGLPELQEDSWNTIQQKFPEVSKCEEFLHVTKDELILIIGCKDLFTSKEEDVCDAVLQWVRGDKARKKGLKEVFQVLRLTQMSLDYLCNIRDCEEIEECSGCRSLVLEAIDKINSALPNEYTCPESEYRQEEVICMVGTRSREPNPQKIEVLCYSFRHNSKFKLSTLPVEPGPCFAVCILNRDIYISGGYNEQNLMLHFNTEQNMWTECKKMVIERWSHSMVAVGKHLYLVGGTSKTNETLSSIEKFDPETETYEEVGQLEVPVSSMTAAVFGTKIITFGGKLKDRTAASVIQYFDVATKTKGLLGNLPETCAGIMGRAVHFEDKLIIIFREGQIVEYSEDRGASIVCNIVKFDHFGAVMHEGEVLILGNRSGTFYAVLFNPHSGKARNIPAPFKAPMCNFYCLQTIVSKRYLK
ncbi:kelch-like protein 24 [Saccostrea echinata]|uniref:kelch-like protein 24 n=1 Tax=Saccostrea echinata TaxID=191078 RepID=UPI002A83835D|nr:kelch-like protein 24 [Saccostrea echinata]XP_061181005.1 kelch-like protein 24 [Saccostrea echinata]